MKDFLSSGQAEAAAERIRAYAQPRRLMILSLLLRGERTVGEIDEMTGIGQPALSQQLAELRRAELVKTRRAAKQVYYRIVDDRVALCIRTIEAMFGDADEPSEALLRVFGEVSEPPSRAPLGAASFASVK